MPYKDPEKEKAYKKEYRKRPGVRKRILEKNRNRMRKLRSDPSFRNLQNKKRREKRYSYKIAIIEHYSNGTMKCACCGINDTEFLTIDHINGNGVKHRKEIKIDFYLWLKRNRFPDGFQVLCMNCQFGRKFCGECPHKYLIA